MLTPDQIRTALADTNLQRVAEATGLSSGTIYLFMGGTRGHTYKTVQILSDYVLEKQRAVRKKAA